MSNKIEDDETRDVTQDKGEFTFEYSFWRGVKVSVKNMDVETYKAMFQETLSLRRPVIWLILIMIVVLGFLALFKPELVELLSSG